MNLPFIFKIPKNIIKYPDMSTVRMVVGFSVNIPLISHSVNGTLNTVESHFSLNGVTCVFCE